MSSLAKISPEVLVLAVVGASVLGYSLKVVLTRVVGHVVEVGLGVLVAAGVYVLAILWLPELQERKRKESGERGERLVFRQYAFVEKSKWTQELINLSSDKSLPTPVFPDSFVLSDSIDGLLELINRDFIQSWYSKFSGDKVFSASVDRLLRIATGELGERLAKVEWADFLVGSVMPLVTDHFSRYVSAVSAIREKSSGGHLTPSAELDAEIASQYRQKLHVHGPFLTKNFEYEGQRKKWLAGRVEKILPLLFSKVAEEGEMQSKIVTRLVTEIVANSVLSPILQMTSDPDFWNQIVIRSAGSTIQDQNKVNRLREALDQHTGSTTVTGTRSRLKGMPRQVRLRFSPNSDQNKFDKFIRNIYKCQSLAEARQTRYSISVQLQRAVKDGNDKVFISRLEQAKAAIDKQIGILSGIPSTSKPASHQIDAPTAPSSLAVVPSTVVMSSMGRSSPAPMFASSLLSPSPKNERMANSATKSVPAAAAGAAAPAASQEDYTLLDILNDSACSLYFMEYMDQRRHTELLQFWLTVNSLWKQGEDDHLLSRHDTPHQQDPLGGLSIGDAKENNNSPNIEQDELFIDDGTSKADILQIYYKYFANDAHRLKEITPEAYQRVSTFVNTPQATVSQYKLARQAIMATQQTIYKTLEAKYLPKFKNSDLYLKYLASNPPPINRISSTIDNLQMDAITTDDNSVLVNPALDKTQNAKVVMAVEEAFQDIMSGSTSSLTPQTNSATQLSPSSTSPIGIKTSKKDRAGLSELLGEENDAPTREKRRGALFDSEDEFDEENSDDDNNEEEFSLVGGESFPDVHLAAPGDLGLTEAITMLSKEIANLYSQEEVVDFLLKKAELTNNQSQLRILQKSKASLDREIHRKELQRQQYIVQESENSLYGKSDIFIQSYVHGIEDGGEYVLYIIEVQKLDAEGNQTAGWIVARRYSQFFDLHQHLKDQFAGVRKLDFPRKRVFLKFQPKTLVDARRVALEKYLKELLKMPDVCQSKAFRLFLSSETFSVDSLAPSTADSGSPHGSPSLSSSALSFDSQDDSISNSSRRRAIPSILVETDSGLADEVAATKATTGRNQFIQPICNLFIEVFGIDAGDNWLRGRAVVVVLQQLLGGTIEKKVRDVVSSLTSVKSVTDVIQTVRNSVWPGGSLKKSAPPRTASEKIKTRHDAMILLQQLIYNASARVIGGSSSRYAARHLFSMYQNQILNTYLVFSLTDMLLKELFPELTQDDDGSL
ncbi:Mdm1p [Sugiyamaella lignohabitans]|uniref:Mdm1p n=1 Tax=Sugiyamaella lignohabitans TaxID=796027 RepID=A0A167ELM6_9ASCO|nr:Mdm1p [Sugiyamaella lignohabitans]ANB14223.1 Mdm1p [Sugiyamaella lignohabitans]